MAQIPVPGYNPVPLGREGSGEAFILQGAGLGALTQLRQQDAIAARAREREAMRKQKEGQEAFKVFASAKLDTKGFLPFQPQLDQEAPAAYDELLRNALDPRKDAYQKKIDQDKIVAKRAGRVNLTNEIEQKVNLLRGTVKADKRYNAAAVDKDWYEGFGVGIDDYDPVQLDRALENPRNFNETEVVKQWLDKTFKDEQDSMARASTTSQFGQKNTAISNIFEVENGKLKLDPKTSKPILRTDAPEALLAAINDPFLGPLLSYKQDQYDEQVQGVMGKMQNMEPLTDEERQLADEYSTQPKGNAEFLAELVIPHGYKRTSTAQIAKVRPPAAPRGSSSSAGPVVQGGGGFGVAGIGTAVGSRALPSPFVGGQPFNERKDGTRVPVTAKGVVFRNVHVQYAGGKISKLENNTEGQEMLFGAPRMVLVNKSGNIVWPESKTVKDAIASGDEGKAIAATEEWFVGALSRPDAKEKGYRITYAVEATPVKGENRLGSEEEVYNSIKSSYTEQARNAADRDASPSRMSEAEMRERARKIFQKQNATYYPLYEGEDKRKIDGFTPGYRQQEADMRAKVDRLNSMVRPKAKADPMGYTPKPAATNSKVKLVGKNNALGF